MEWLTKETHESDADVLRRALSEDIHKFSMVPDLTDEQFAANASGVAMRYKLLGLEQLTGVKERYFREGLRCRVRLFAHYLALLGEREIVPERVRFIFTRSLPVNDTEQAQIVRELHGIVPDEQLLRNCPSCAISAPTQASAKRRNQPCRTNLKKTRKNA